MDPAPEFLSYSSKFALQPLVPSHVPESLKSYLPKMIVVAIFFSVTFALSPQEFQNFYDPQYTRRPTDPRFPKPHFVRPPTDSSLHFNGPNYFAPNRAPQTTRIPFNMHTKFQNPRPTLNQFPYRPSGPFSQNYNPTLQSEMNLVKLRKMYSHIKDTNKSPAGYRPNNKYAIPPEYIRYNGLGHHLQEQSIRRPVWRPFPPRRGRKKESTIDTYMGPNNKSIIFATRLQAVVNIDEDLKKYEPDYEQPLDFQNELEETPFSSRPKRFSINKEVMKAFYLQSYMRTCTTSKGQEGRCMDYLPCYKTQGSPQISKQCSLEACCVYSIKGCGRSVSRNNTIWETPEDKSYGDSCILRVAKISQAICQIRLDLREFKLKEPANGTCLEDKLIVTGQNINSIIPQLCGLSPGDHMYIDVDNVTGPIYLNIVSVGSFDRKWDIKISQIECSNNLNRPPRNCLQYYTNTSDTFGSFNRNNTARQYLNNLNYAICLRKAAGFCSIQYDLSPEGIFNFTNTAENGTPTVTPGNAGVGVVDCPDDYLVIAGNRLCGDRFNDGSNPTMSENTKVEDSTNGPFVIQVMSNENSVSEGFQLNYYQIPCS